MPLNESPNIREWNTRISNSILDQSNCHCTTRTVTSTTSAIARFNHNNQQAAVINWNHGTDRTIVSWSLSIGSFITRTIPYTATQAEINSILLTGFLTMHTQWGGSDYTGLDS